LAGWIADRSVPGRPHENVGHPAKPRHTSHYQPCTHEPRHSKKPGRNEKPQQGPEECQAAGADLYLPLQLNWLTTISHYRQPSLLPGVNTAIDNKGFANAADFLRKS